MNRIKELREARGWRLEELAARVGVTSATVSRWENGERFPRGENLRVLAKALGVRPADLIEAIVGADRLPDVRPAKTEIAAQMARLGYSAYVVIGDSVSRAGVSIGDTILVDATGDHGLAECAPGSVALLSFGGSFNSTPGVAARPRRDEPRRRQFCDPGIRDA